jgi:hypothetical protein
MPDGQMLAVWSLNSWPNNCQAAFSALLAKTLSFELILSLAAAAATSFTGP